MTETTRDTLTHDEAMIVRLIRIGFTRRRIARLLGAKEDDVREIIGGLCAHYDCTTAQLATVAYDDMPDERRLMARGD